MKILGLTGNTGSGKTTVSAMLSVMGACIIDADKIAYEVMLRGNPAYDEVVSLFGEDILDKSLEINRKTLASIVFTNKDKLTLLSEAVHKHVIKITKDVIDFASKKNKNSFIVIDAPLLIEANMHRMCDEVWLIYADEQTRIKRVIHRDVITIDQALERINSQTEYQELQQYATRVIYNTDNIDNLKLQVKYALLNFIR